MSHRKRVLGKYWRSERSGGRNLEVFGQFALGEVLQDLGQHKRRVNGVNVRMGSARYRVFAKSAVCAKCGIEGKFFLLERQKNAPKNSTAHYNLYALDGEDLVLMTKDHIVARSNGGSNSDSNLQTMCMPCNSKKGNK